jgi:hypothetical protein
MRPVLSTTSNRKTLTIIPYLIVSAEASSLEHLIGATNGFRRRSAAPVGVPITTTSRRAPRRRGRSYPALPLFSERHIEAEPHQRFAVSVVRRRPSGVTRQQSLRWQGTGSSNPSPSSGESGANLSLAGIRLPTSRSRGFRGCAGRGERRGRQRRAGHGNIGPTGGNISVGLSSSTAPPLGDFEFGSGSGKTKVENPGLPRGCARLAWRQGRQRRAGCFDIAPTGGRRECQAVQ